MEFEELQKVWDTQRQQTLYAIDEEALHRRIVAKAKAATRWLSINEIGLIIISLVTGGILIGDAIADQEGVWDYAGGALFVLIAGWLAVRRRNRLRAQPRFDRSLRGDLEAALTGTQQLIRLNQVFQYGFLLPAALFSIGSMLWRGSPWASLVLIIGANVLAWVLVRWELRAKFLPRKKELIRLRELLTNELTDQPD